MIHQAYRFQSTVCTNETADKGFKSIINGSLGDHRPTYLSVPDLLDLGDKRTPCYVLNKYRRIPNFGEGGIGASWTGKPF